VGQHADNDSGVEDLVEAELLWPWVRALSGEDCGSAKIRGATGGQCGKSRFASDSNNRWSERHA
jgi:hypothetical protein